MKLVLRLGAAFAPVLLAAGCGGQSSGDAGNGTIGQDAATAAPEEATSESGASVSLAEAAGESAATALEANSSPQPQAAAVPAATAVPPATFAMCRSCHTVEPGKNGIGPSLHGVVGRQAGSIEGFNYSPALKQSGIIWDRTSLNTWLSGPMQMVPGTRMVLSLRDEEQRKAVIDYLETLK